MIIKHLPQGGLCASAVSCVCPSVCSFVCRMKRGRVMAATKGVTCFLPVKISPREKLPMEFYVCGTRAYSWCPWTRHSCLFTGVTGNFFVKFNPLFASLKQQSNGPSHSNTVIGTLAVDGWAVTFGAARRGLGGAAARPGPSSLYQMQQPTHQRPVYELRIIRCGTIIAFGV